MVLMPMRPSFFVSPMLVMPTMSEVKTTGTIIILMRLMNIVPMGAIHHLMKGSASGPAMSPTTTDSTRARKILTDKFIETTPLHVLYCCGYLYYTLEMKDCLWNISSIVSSGRRERWRGVGSLKNIFRGDCFPEVPMI